MTVRLFLIGLILAGVTIVFFGGILDRRAYWFVIIGLPLFGTLLLTQAVFSTWFQQRCSNRRMYRLLPDRFETYEAGSFKGSIELGEDASYRVEGASLWLVGKRVTDGSRRLPLPGSSFRREAVLAAVADRLPPLPAVEEAHPVSTVFKPRDPLLLAIGSTWVVVSLLAFAIIIRAAGLSVDASMYGLMIPMGITFAAGPGWLWIGSRYGWGRFRHGRYRVAAFVCNCFATGLVGLSGLLLIALLVADFRDV
jgi:hypothetical protein